MELQKSNHLKQLVCPYCDSSYQSKRGKTSDGRQCFQCKKCKKFWREGARAYKNYCVNCDYCGSSKVFKNGNTKGAKNKFECQDCKKNWTEGAVKPYIEICPMLCLFCQINNVRKAGSPKGKQYFSCKDCKRRWLGDITGILPLQLEVNPEAEYKKDIWDVRKLGLKGQTATSDYLVNFTQICQEWLKEATKKFVKFTLATMSFGTARNRLLSLNRFSKFLTKINPDIAPEQINREVIVDFIIWLSTSELDDASRSKTISHLSLFQELCLVDPNNKWLNITPIPLIRRGDRPKKKHPNNPRFITEFVISQLLEYLDHMPRPLARMVLVLLDCGMRISELCELKFDCLYQASTGNWYMRYYQFKQKKEHTIPIILDLAQVIQEQQAYIRQQLGQEFEYLFCARTSGSTKSFRPIPKPMLASSFAGALNKLAELHTISDENGKHWHFTPHQFRHTVATRMANRGVSPILIQKFLGHDSPNMTLKYIALHDETERREFDAYMEQGRVVDIEGRAIGSLGDEIQSDEIGELEWLRENLQSQALANGYCRRPKLLGDCPTPPACLNCPCFATTAKFLPQHEEQLANHEKAIAFATQRGMARMIDINEQPAKSLRKIIKVLKTEGKWQCGKGIQRD